MATSNVTTVSPQVWERYSRVEAGEKVKDVAAATGVNASTVTAQVKQIRDALAAGKDVQVNGQSVQEGAPVKVDPRALAEDMMPGASLFVDALDKIRAEHRRVEDRITTLQDDLSKLTAREQGTRDLAEHAGFSMEEFEAKLADAETAAAAAQAAAESKAAA